MCQFCESLGMHMVEITSEEEQRVVGDEIVTSSDFSTNLGARADHQSHMSVDQLGNFTWLWSGGVIYQQEYQGCWSSQDRATQHSAGCLYMAGPATVDQGDNACDVGRFLQSGRCEYRGLSACEV